MELSEPKVMGIVNLTTDSFYDGGRIRSDMDLLHKVEQMLVEGADMIDVGAYSSRPGAHHITVEAELETAQFGINAIIKEFASAIVSIDTFRMEVARNALDAGAMIVNDISGGQLDGEMFDFIARTGVPYIIMHMRGTPQTMASMTDYCDLTGEVMDYFVGRIKTLTDMGVKDIIVDPGFGFAKTREQNFELLNKLELLNVLGVPMLCGISRKSMIFKTLSQGPDEALNGTTALNMVCLMKGANILRVHDVKEAKETISLYQSMIKS